MFRRLAAVALAALVLPVSALAGGGEVDFEGASPAERSAVRAALDASSFDWGILPQPVIVHVGPYGTSHATPGHVWLDRGLLAAGKFAWATVMDEFAHQVDFLLLDDARRALLQARLGGTAWCRDSAPGLPHAAYGCERFSSMVAWAYWPTRENSYRPESATDESAAMAPAEFRLLLSALVGAPSALQSVKRTR